MTGGLFSRQREMSRSWTFETRAASEIIWKLLISPSGILTGEERDIESKTGSLFAIDVQAGSVLWRGVTLDEPWWFDSDRATADTLYIQSFHQPNLPEPKGITAINIRTGEIRWQQPDFALLGTLPERVLVVRQGFSGQDYFALDAKSGEIIEELGAVQPDIPENDDLLETHFASPLKEMPAMLAGAIRLEDVRGPIDELRYGFYGIYGLHLRSQNRESKTLSTELLVFDTRSSKLVFRETIHAETPLPASWAMLLPDNFFVSHDFLLYVKEKRTLVGVDLRMAARA